MKKEVRISSESKERYDVELLCEMNVGLLEGDEANATLEDVEEFPEDPA